MFLMQGSVGLPRDLEMLLLKVPPGKAFSAFRKEPHENRHGLKSNGEVDNE